MKMLSLCVRPEFEYQFEITAVGWFERLRWAWNASDPAAQIASRLGILGLILGILGVVLGGIALYKEDPNFFFRAEHVFRALQLETSGTLKGAI